MREHNHPPVLFETYACHHGYQIGVATLNAEQTLNALSLDMINLLSDQLTAWAADDSIVMLLLQASGEKAFCAGGDLQQLYQSMRTHHASDEKDDIRANTYATDFFAREYRLDYLIHCYPKPILCWGHGIVMGGGMGLMAGASHRVVTEKSRLAMPEIGIGLFPDVGGSWFLSRMPDHLGLFLALTGVMVNAADALFCHLADYAVAHDNKASVLEALKSQAWNSQYQHNSQLLDAVLRQPAHTLTLAHGSLRESMETINSLCAHDDLADTIAAIKAHQPEQTWFKKAINSVRNGSPSSIQLANLLLQRAATMPLSDVFRMEYIAALHCAARPDFAEGIRALLVDKDQQPQWQPATHADMSPQWINSYLDSPWAAQAHPLADLGAYLPHRV